MLDGLLEHLYETLFLFGQLIDLLVEGFHLGFCLFVLFISLTQNQTSQKISKSRASVGFIQLKAGTMQTLEKMSL